MPQLHKYVNFEHDISDDLNLTKRGQKEKRVHLPTNLSSVLKTLLCITCLAISFAIILKFVGVEAQIADYEFQRQKLTSALQQSKLNCAQLEVDIAQLDSATRFEKIAEVNNLYFPLPVEIAYVTSTKDFPQIASSTANNIPAKDNWAAAASKEVAAGFSTIFYRLNHAGNPAAFAQ